jgi:DNA primase
MPAEFVSFDELKRATTIEAVAQWLGLDMKQQGNQLRGPCPKNGGSRCLVITPAIQSFYCHSPRCGVGGDLIALIAHVQGIEVREAALLLQNHLYPKVQELKELDYLIAQCHRVQDLGLPAHVAKAIGAGYAPRGTCAGRLAIPMRTREAKLVGYVGIGLDLDPPIRFPKNWFL